MKTLVRKSVACILLFTYVFLLPQAMAYAVPSASKDAQPTVLYTDKNEVICADLVQIINTMGVKINEKTEITFTSIESRSNASAIVITNTAGNLVTKDIIFSLDQDGNIDNLRAYNADVVAKSTRDGQSVDHTYNGKIAIRGTAVYNVKRHQYSDYYQPIGVFFIYEKLSSCDVGYIEVEYDCSGFEYTYPGFEYIGTGNAVADIYGHIINVRKNNPSENTIYDKTAAYRTDRVIWADTGRPNPGQYLSFEYQVDSVTRSLSYQITG